MCNLHKLGFSEKGAFRSPFPLPAYAEAVIFSVSKGKGRGPEKDPADAYKGKREESFQQYIGDSGCIDVKKTVQFFKRLQLNLMELSLRLVKFM